MLEVRSLLLYEENTGGRIWTDLWSVWRSTCRIRTDECLPAVLRDVANAQFKALSFGQILKNDECEICLLWPLRQGLERRDEGY